MRWLPSACCRLNHGHDDSRLQSLSAATGGQQPPAHAATRAASRRPRAVTWAPPQAGLHALQAHCGNRRFIVILRAGAPRRLWALCSARAWAVASRPAPCRADRCRCCRRSLAAATAGWRAGSAVPGRRARARARASPIGTRCAAAAPRLPWTLWASEIACCWPTGCGRRRRRRRQPTFAACRRLVCPQELRIFKQRTLAPSQLEVQRQLAAEKVDVGRVSCRRCCWASARRHMRRVHSRRCFRRLTHAAVVVVCARHAAAPFAHRPACSAHNRCCMPGTMWPS